MSDITIERLTSYDADDARAIGQLMPYLSARLSSDPIDETLLRAIIDSPFHEQLVARKNGVIVGVATLTLLMGPAVQKAGYLEDFVTDPTVRGAGIGRLLWDEMMAWCRERGVSLTFTSKPSRTDAHRFYKARGATVHDTVVFKATP